MAIEFKKIFSVSNWQLDHDGHGYPKLFLTKPDTNLIDIVGISSWVISPSYIPHHTLYLDFYGWFIKKK